MLKLPNNATLAALALALGAVLGAGGYHFLSGDADSNTPLARMGEVEGTAVVEHDRPLAPRDTASQSEPDVEIRYRRDTVTLRDTIWLRVPTSLPSKPVLSDRTPLKVTSDRVVHSYWDPLDQRFEQRVYSVPTDPFTLRAYATTRAYTPAGDVSLGLDRTWVGVGVTAKWRRLEATAAALTTPDLGRQRVAFGVRYWF